MAHDIIERIARIVAAEDFSLAEDVRAGRRGGTEAEREKTVAKIEAGPLQDAREKALEILAVLREVDDTDGLPRYASGDWSRRNLEAFVDDMAGKPL